MKSAISNDNPVNARHEKRSFLKLPVSIDAHALVSEYESIPQNAWMASHWDTHCSVTMLLLRGGQTGTAMVFTSNEVCDHEILTKLPYMSWLLDKGGPFGGATYAFIFRMKPMGVARQHVDCATALQDPFRIHIPSTTNDEALFLSEGRAKHFRVGEVWTFDNQREHAVLNGDHTRTHLIIDVPPNPKLEELLLTAEWDPGIEDSERWERTCWPDSPKVFVPASSVPISLAEKVRLGLNPEGFASRISIQPLMARLTGTPLRESDVIYSVNGIEECPVARSATDYILLRHKPGERIGWAWSGQIND